MSIKLMSVVWELDLPPGEKLVLLALADQASDAGVQCWPSVATIAKRSGQGERTVRRALADLEKQGHLTRNHRDGNSTQYHVHPCQTGTPAIPAPLPNTPETPAKLAGKPSGTVISSEAKASSPRAKFSCPVGVTSDQWKAFKAQRKKSLNDRSYILLTNKLRALADAGYPPGEMIDLAIERGWETVFEPFKSKDQRNGGHHQHPGLGKTAAAIAMLGDWNDERPM